MSSAAQYDRAVQSCIRQRIKEKQRAPYATAARNALKKGRAQLAKQAGTWANIETPAGALETLQRGEPVTLRAHRCIHEGTDLWADPDRYELVGELVVQIKVT